MPKNLGRVFRSLRQAKGISLEEATGGRFSISQLSRFEHGKSDLSVSKMLIALKILQVTTDEFLSIAREFEENEIHQFSSKVEKYLKQENTYMLRKLLMEKKKKMSTNLYRLEVQMLTLLVEGLRDRKKILQYEQNFMDYFCTIEHWGYFELMLFSNILDSISQSSLRILTRQMIEQTVLHEKNPRKKRKIARILLEIVRRTLEEKKFQEASLLLVETKRLLSDETYLLEKNILLFMDGYYSLCIGKLEKGRKKMETVIKIFEQLESYEYASLYSELYQEILDKEFAYL